MSVSYYDVVLGLVPLSALIISGLLIFAGLPYTLAIPIASLMPIALIGHAMFVNGPVSAPVQEPLFAETGKEVHK